MMKLSLSIRKNLKWLVLFALAIFSLILWSIALRENRNGILKVVFLNVGQGDSIFIESPTGTQVLVDGGPDKNLMKEISAVMPWYDRHVDMIVITNPDTDHYSGFIPLLQKYNVDVEMEPGTKAGSESYATLADEMKNKKIPQVIGRRGEAVDLGGGAYLQILFPDRDVSGVSTNEGSLVMRLVYGQTSVSLQGDSPKSVEDYLISLGGGNLKSDILKTGHHGSKTSSGEEYVSAVSPKWTVVSAGENNSYGHPNQETLETMQKLNIPVLATCAMGNITFLSDGQNFVLQNKNIKNVTAGCKK